jgi:hypothetical protein
MCTEAVSPIGSPLHIPFLSLHRFHTSKDISPARNANHFCFQYLSRLTVSVMVIRLIKITVFCDVTLRSLEESAASVFRVKEASALTMEKAGSSETLVPVYQTTRRYIPLTHNLNHLKTSGHYIYTVCLNTLKLCILPTQCICVFRMVLKINSDCFPKQH